MTNVKRLTGEGELDRRRGYSELVEVVSGNNERISGLEKRMDEFDRDLSEHADQTRNQFVDVNRKLDEMHETVKPINEISSFVQWLRRISLFITAIGGAVGVMIALYELIIGSVQ